MSPRGIPLREPTVGEAQAIVTALLRGGTLTLWRTYLLWRRMVVSYRGDRGDLGMCSNSIAPGRAPDEGAIALPSGHAG